MDKAPKDKDFFLYRLTPLGKAVRERFLETAVKCAMSEVETKAVRQADSGFRES